MPDVPYHSSSGGSATAIRRQREWVRHRAEILDAAARLAVQDVWDSVTMERIAREAEFAVGTLYRFFQSKQDLRSALVDEAARRLIPPLLECLKGPVPALERLDRFIQTFADGAATDPDVTVVYLRSRAWETASGEESHGGAEASSEAARLTRELNHALDRVLIEGMTDRQVVRMEPWLLRVSLMGILTALIHHSRRQAGDQDGEAIASAAKSIFFDAVRIKPRVRLASTT